MVLFNLKGDEVQHYRSVFNSWSSGTGSTMTVDDVVRLLKKMLADRQVPANFDIRLLASDMITSLDISGHSLSLQAFLDYMATKSEIRDVHYEYTEAFKLFDTEGKGRLGVEDMKMIIMKLNPDVTDKTVQEMVRIADIDGDGTVDYEEFVKMVEMPH